MKTYLNRHTTLTFLLLATLCLTSIQSFSQMVHVKEKASGYLGKKALLGFSGMFGLSGEPQKASTSSNYLSPSANKTFGLSIQYVISNHSAIRTAINISNTSATIADVVLSSGYSYGNENDISANNETYILDQINGTPKISDKSFEIEYKYFRPTKGGIAPLGPYLSGGISVHNIEIDLSTISLQAYSTNWRDEETMYELSYQDPIEKRTLFELYTKAGFSKVITDFLLLDANVRVGYMPSMLVDVKSEVNTRVRKEIYKRLTNKQYINFELTLAIPL
ncbi:MAG: hypothetical protein ACI80H_001505 [Pseudoalteromonas distincta]